MAPDQIIPIIGAGTMLALSFAVASRAVTPGLWMLVLSQVTTRIFTRSLQTAAIASV